MRARYAWIFGLVLWMAGVGSVHAMEEGELVKKDGRWEYVTAEDPGLKFLLDKHIITQEEYDRGSKILEERYRLLTPAYHINYGDGLNIKTGDRFLLKLRALVQFRYSNHNYNSAWRSIGDANNFPEFGTTFQTVKHNDLSANTFSTQFVRLQFLGYAFDPDFRYNVTFAADRGEGNPGTTGSVFLIDAYVASWHVSYANLWVGQYRVWFNRSQITSIANLTFVDRMIVQNAFPASAINRRDMGITLLSDENKHRFNYAIGVFNGTGINEDRLGNPVVQNNTSTHYNANELMYVARLLWKVSGNPGYGEGDILYSRIPQVALGAGYANNPGVNLLNPSAAVRNQVLAIGNGRLVGAGIMDLQTYEVDFVAKYRGWALQAEGYIRQQQVRGGNPSLGSATGWYVQLGKFVIPRKIELAARYGLMDPNTLQSHDLVKEAAVAVNYSLDGTYNHRIVTDFTNITMGAGGYAAGRTTVSTQDLVDNRLRVMYQFYW